MLPKILSIFTVLLLFLTSFFPRFPAEIAGRPVYLLFSIMFCLSLSFFIIGLFTSRSLISLTGKLEYYKRLSSYPELLWKIRLKNFLISLVVITISLFPAFHTIVDIKGWGVQRASEIQSVHPFFEELYKNVGALTDQQKYDALEKEKKVSAFLGTGLPATFSDIYTFGALIKQKPVCLYVYNGEINNTCGPYSLKYRPNTLMIIKHLFSFSGDVFDYKAFIKEL